MIESLSESTLAHSHNHMSLADVTVGRNMLSMLLHTQTFTAEVKFLVQITHSHIYFGVISVSHLFLFGFLSSFINLLSVL